MWKSNTKFKIIIINSLHSHKKKYYGITFYLQYQSKLMKFTQNKAFTLVELLVVITILAIMSVVAYQSFGWATDKAHNTTKKSNVTLLWNTLWIFHTEKNYYPMPQEISPTNLWGYNSGATAQASNTISVTYSDQEISTINPGSTAGGWVIYWTGAWAKSAQGEQQVWAKWVIWTIGQFNKKYLKEDIFDVQLWDIKLVGESDKKMIDYGIGKFSYAVYARPSVKSNWNVSWTKGTYYSIAATFKDTEAEWYHTFTIWNYSTDNFNSPTTNYPDTLLGVTQDEKDRNVWTNVSTQGIPYPIDNFSR